MIKQFFDFDIDSCVKVVKEGDTLNTGNHELQFILAPMVHWPEVMVTFDKTTGTLFSADAFGSFGAINGNLFDDEVEWERDYLDEARRYFTNIVGKNYHLLAKEVIFTAGLVLEDNALEDFIFIEKLVLPNNFSAKIKVCHF